MIKDLLKKTQPVVYQALENALKNRHVSHSYLFLGPAGTPKKQTAVLMAQSLLCERPGMILPVRNAAPAAGWRRASIWMSCC
jgi:DNA polymerase-3 subunit delta'